jgi:hypothetical protein
MKVNSKSRRLEHRANMRKLAAGQLNEAETKAVQAAEKARKDVKPPAVLNRKQRKNKRHAARAAK